MAQLPYILGATTAAIGTSFLVTHYAHSTVFPFDVLGGGLAFDLSWCTPQHMWGLAFAVVGIFVLIPLSPLQRAIGLIFGTFIWGGFGAAMVYEAMFMDPLHQVGGAGGMAFLGMAVVFIYAARRVVVDPHTFPRYIAGLRRRARR